MPVLVWLVLALLVFALVGTAVSLWWERRHPSSYTEGREYRAGLWVPSLPQWRRMSTAEQAAYDAGVMDATADAQEAARVAVDALLERDVAAVKRNALFHP
ncbi:hypothetical protein [Streptomyces sp. NPDC005548]|uniref:hypothetical protein n=1 Tax=Streptomyces sp. NPDC005548 TaxID=3364724 RepID=UPI00368B27B7